MRNRASQRGFTIVELLIVIVVIGILAAITIVAFQGVQNRAKVATLQSDLTGAAKSLATFKFQNASEQYPADLAAAQAAGLKSSTGVSYQYSVNNSVSPATFCVTATTGTTSYWVSNASSIPTSGGCSGHGVGGVAAITNLVYNSSMDAVSPAINGVGTVILTTSDKYSGSSSALVTKGSAHAYVIALSSTAGASMSGKTYVLSAWVKTSISSIRTVVRPNGSGYSPAVHTIPPDTWTRITRTFTVSVSDTARPQLDIGHENADLAQGSQFYVDAVMLTEGSILYTCADGNSPGWIWNGTANNSTSTGPPL